MSYDSDVENIYMVEFESGRIIHLSFYEVQDVKEYCADEYPNEQLIALLPEILESNPDVDLYWVPRINTVEGITPEHIQQWRWNVNEKGWVNFPDYQSRLYRKTQSITWVNKVHERINGAQVFTHLPAEEDFCLYHPKTIERQEKQNNYYNTL